MKLKAGFYMEDDGTIWLVYPDGSSYRQTLFGVQYIWHPFVKQILLEAKKTYIGL